MIKNTSNQIEQPISLALRLLTFATAFCSILIAMYISRIKYEDSVFTNGVYVGVEGEVHEARYGLVSVSEERNPFNGLDQQNWLSAYRFETEFSASKYVVPESTEITRNDGDERLATAKSNNIYHVMLVSTTANDSDCVLKAVEITLDDENAANAESAKVKVGVARISQGKAVLRAFSNPIDINPMMLGTEFLEAKTQHNSILAGLTRGEVYPIRVRCRLNIADYLRAKILEL